ncbi:MAG: hypothetical protein ABWX59_07755 [Microbacteriaceae bacterium]
MIPFALSSDRLRLDQLVTADAALVVEYCQDPVLQAQPRTTVEDWPV